MTTKKTSSKPPHNMGKLKATLLVGTVLATFLGADLIANRDSVSNQVESQPVVIQAQDPTKTIVIDTSPIPKIAIPQPIARSRSSR